MSEEDIFKDNSKFSDQKKSQHEKTKEDDSYKPVRHKNKRGFFSRFFRFIFRSITYAVCSVFAVCGIGTVGLFCILYFFSADLPNHNSLKEYSPLLSSRVFLQDGSKLCEYSTEKRYLVPIELSPDKFF